MEQAIEILKREAIRRLQEAEQYTDDASRQMVIEQGNALMYAVGILRDSMD